MSDEHAILNKLNEVMVEIQTIKRGVYGDEDNEVKGLIHHHRDHLGAGAILALQFIWHFCS
jgi:hypothetical protein